MTPGGTTVPLTEGRSSGAAGADERGEAVALKLESYGPVGPEGELRVLSGKIEDSPEGAA